MAEIAEHLRAVFGQETSDSVEQEGVVGKNRATFRKACWYPDRSRVVVETTLELDDGKTVRQVDAVARDARADRKGDRPKTPPA